MIISQTLKSEKQQRQTSEGKGLLRTYTELGLRKLRCLRKNAKIQKTGERFYCHLLHCTVPVGLGTNLHQGTKAAWACGGVAAAVTDIPRNRLKHGRVRMQSWVPPEYESIAKTREYGPCRTTSLRGLHTSGKVNTLYDPHLRFWQCGINGQQNQSLAAMFQDNNSHMFEYNAKESKHSHGGPAESSSFAAVDARYG